LVYGFWSGDFGKTEKSRKIWGEEHDLHWAAAGGLGVGLQRLGSLVKLGKIEKNWIVFFGIPFACRCKYRYVPIVRYDE